MLRKAWIIGVSAAMAVCVLGATAGFSEDASPPRLRGTIDQVNGNTLTIKTRSGTPTTIQLKDGSPVIATVKGSMSDIQDNSFVGILKYKDGEKTIVVPSDATVVNLIPGDKADLVPGAKIFIPRWAKTADGTWEATVALVGRDGITPPM
jgi:hypothetical protein